MTQKPDTTPDPTPSADSATAAAAAPEHTQERAQPSTDKSADSTATVATSAEPTEPAAPATSTDRQAAAASANADTNADSAEDAKKAENTDNAADTEASADLAQQLQAALAEAASQKEHHLRVAAELENVQRRSEKKIADAHQFALSDFALAVGEVRDCLETALDTSTDTPEKMREGVALTLRKLVSAMDKRHILPIKPDVGALFDPAIHMAIGKLPVTAQAPADTVAAVVQNGYMLNGRVIRAANVMVAFAAADNDNADNATGTDDKANNATTTTAS